MNESIEVELKVPLETPDKVRHRLEQMEAFELNTETQRDDYFDHPCRSFFKTDEAAQRTMDYERHAPGTGRTNLRAKVAHRQDTEMDKTSGDGKPAGPVFDIEPSSEQGDGLDAEFERY